MFRVTQFQTLLEGLFVVNQPFNGNASSFVFLHAFGERCFISSTKQMWKEAAHKNALWDSCKVKDGSLEPPAGHMFVN